MTELNTEELKAATLAVALKNQRFDNLHVRVIAEAFFELGWEDATTALIERLQVAEDAAKDAERYRLLRNSEWEMFESNWLHMHDLYGAEAMDMDAFIDAAIAAWRMTP